MLTENEFNKRRRTNACIHCGEVGQKYSNCLKPEPWLLESVIDSIVPITQTLILESSYVINELCVIESNYDYRIDPIEHYLNRESELSLSCGRNIDKSLTSTDIALSSNLGVVNKESSHHLKERDVGHKLK